MSLLAVRCPVCKLDAVSTPTCRRCKADLQLLLQVETQRRHAQWQTLQALRQADAAQADYAAEKADLMHGDRQTLRLRALTALLKRQFALAVALHAMHATAASGDANKP